MKKSIRKVMALILALALVCSLAVSGLAITIGDSTFYHEYVLVEHYLTLLERVPVPMSSSKIPTAVSI